MVAVRQTHTVGSLLIRPRSYKSAEKNKSSVTARTASQLPGEKISEKTIHEERRSTRVRQVNYLPNPGEKQRHEKHPIAMTIEKMMSQRTSRIKKLYNSQPFTLVVDRWLDTYSGFLKTMENWEFSMAVRNPSYVKVHASS